MFSALKKKADFQALNKDEQVLRIKYGERFLHFITEEMGLTIPEFCKELSIIAGKEYSDTNISKVANGLIPVPGWIVKYLVSKYDLNTAWLNNNDGEPKLLQVLTIDERINDLSKSVKALSSVNKTLLKTIQGMRDEMIQLKQDVAKLKNSKSKTNADQE